jgi:hypothetical protein
MGLRGQRPKPPGQAVTRNPRLYDWIAVEAVPNTTGPRLPPRRANGRSWPRSAKEKWRAWARMPHTVLWADSDWSFAADSLELVARAAENDAPPVALLSEIRLREKEMGANLGCTPDAAAALRCVAPGQGRAGRAGVAAR